MSLRLTLAATSLLGGAAILALACGSSGSASTSAAPQESTSRVAQAYTDELSAYAAGCDAIMGSDATVPAFDCDTQGIDIPVTLDGVPFQPAAPGAVCDTPDMFSGGCTPHQKLVPLASTATSTTVAICRRFIASGAGGYDDIEVIQHDKSTGDTCFYTTSPNLSTGAPRPAGSIPGAAPSPSAGVGSAAGGAFWETPSALASDPGSQCISCHDNGPFIRSPFVKATSSSLPAAFVADLGFGNDAYNLTQPYRIYGRTFALAGWRAVSVSLANDATCTTCHRMGANAFASSGTGAYFGPASVACYGNQEPDCAAFNRPDDFAPDENPDAAHWMTPSHPGFDPSLLDAAHQVQDCANAWLDASRASPPGSLPPNCVAQPLTELCQNDSQCTGSVPRICRTCSDGSYACAHNVCANNLCGVEVCP